jgi:hypothetical protein
MWKLTFSFGAGALLSWLILGWRHQPPQPPSLCAGTGLSVEDRALLFSIANQVGRCGASQQVRAAPSETAAGVAKAPPATESSDVTAARALAASDQARAARDAGQKTLDDAIARGEWLQDDVSRVRRIWFQLAPEDRRHLMVSVTNALNERRMTANFPGPIF